MLRKKRVTGNTGVIASIVEQCRVCRLGFFDGESVYVIPMSFGWELKSAKSASKNDAGEDIREEMSGSSREEISDGGASEPFVFYFHCASRGRKLDILAQGRTTVAIEMDIWYPPENRGPDGVHYRSVTGSGVMSRVTDSTEKQHALALVRSHTLGVSASSRTNRDVSRICVLRLVTDRITAKEH